MYWKNWTGQKREIKINREYLSYLQFADDMVLFSNDGDELQKMIGDLNRESIKVGLKMNMLKTKIMLSSLAKEKEFTNQPQESVEEYVYLGRLLTAYAWKENSSKNEDALEREWQPLQNNDRPSYY